MRHQDGPLRRRGPVSTIGALPTLVAWGGRRPLPHGMDAGAISRRCAGHACGAVGPTDTDSQPFSPGDLHGGESDLRSEAAKRAAPRIFSDDSRLVLPCRWCYSQTNCRMCFRISAA